jgi:pimeloyl-ACP methyl ester carboxylesterase
MQTPILTPFLALRAEHARAAPHRRIRVAGDDGVELLVGVFEPEAPPQDVLLFFHGAGAHMAAGYLELGLELHRITGAAVLLPDLRGHGRSGGLRGELDTPARLWNDVDALVQRALQRYPGARLHLGGHSLGASLCLNWMSHSAQAHGLAATGRLQSLLLLAPYSGLDGVTKAPPSGGAPFITWPQGRAGDACLDYAGDIAAQAGLVRRYQPAMFGALAPADFLAQLRDASRALPVSVLVLRDDEIFDADALLAAIEPLARGVGHRLSLRCVAGGHLSALFNVSADLAGALPLDPEALNRAMHA